jgi:hypothetical protein
MVIRLKKLNAGAFGSVSRPLDESGQERQARPLVIGCSTETGSDAGKVFLRASSSASSWPYAYRYRHRLDEVCVSDRQSFRFF